jgi:hypothetical protein
VRDFPPWYDESAERLASEEDGEGFLIVAEHVPARHVPARPVQLALTPAPDGYGTTTLDEES